MIQSDGKMMCSPHKCHTKCVGDLKLKVYETRYCHIVIQCPCCNREHDHMMHECPHCGFRLHEEIEKFKKYKKTQTFDDPPEDFYPWEY